MSNHKSVLGVALLLPIALAITACQRGGSSADSAASQGPAAAVDQERIESASAGTSKDWATYGGNYEETRFSTLKAINTENVGQLGLAWFADYDTNLDQHGSPLYVDGVIYVSTTWNKVYAFDAKTGKTLWQYDAKVPGEWIRNVCCGIINRGIAAWNGKIYMGTLDGRLVAIDAATGKETWATDVIIGDKNDPLNRYSLTMAPRIAKGKVFIGASGGEYGVRGWIGAFDAETGKEVWRFWTVPGDPAKGFENEAMKKAAATWSGEWWKLGGGGTIWDATVYDPVTDLLYFGTGNGTPWNQMARDPKGGDNLYIASVIAVKADTGEYVWHYQATPGDTWDYDSVSPLMVLELPIDGTKRRVLVQPNKNGFLYVLDAASGKLVSADPFTEVNWATGVDMATGRPKVVEAARYEKRGWNLAPGVQGGHSWHPNAWSPDTGLVYIPTWEAYFPMVNDPAYKPAPAGFNLGISFGGINQSATDLEPTNKTGITGRLKAWDPVQRKVVWETEAFRNDRPSSGVTATAGGLVLAGNGAGNRLRALDAKTGKELWSFDTQTAIYAAPITYELDGEQYVAASVGGNAAQRGGYYAPGYARMLVFKLGATAKLPPNAPYVAPVVDPPPSTATAAVIKQGEEKYIQYCSVCHGVDGVQQRGTFPNLMVSAFLHSQEGFDQIVLGGARKERGMASFAEQLSATDAGAVRGYLISRANVVMSQLPPAPPPAQEGTGDQHQQ